MVSANNKAILIFTFLIITIALEVTGAPFLAYVYKPIRIQDPPKHVIQHGLESKLSKPEDILQTDKIEEIEIEKVVSNILSNILRLARL